MSDEQYVIKIAAGDDFNFTFQTQKEHQNDIHYIGIFPNMVSEIICQLYNYQPVLFT